MTPVIRRVGDYELLGEVGDRGGMSVVYLATQSRLGRQVALKQVDLRGGGELVERFVREAELAGSLNHPNVVTVFDFFEHDGVPFIAMEYLERGSLRPWIGRLSRAQCGGVLEGVLAGLAHAHGQGIVHRDIKPENILVTTTGAIKLADFGIARAFAKVTGRLTRTGMTVGTPAYMAPEQALNGELGPWTDLYSTGVVAYEMLLGRLPFEDTESPVALLLRHVNDPIPPPRQLDRTLDAPVAAWLERMLAKDPPARPASAQAAWEELEDALVGVMGAVWRRSARLLEPSRPARTAKPLTPAPFEPPDGPAPPVEPRPERHEPAASEPDQEPAYQTFGPRPPPRPPTHQPAEPVTEPGPPTNPARDATDDASRAANRPIVERDLKRPEYPSSHQPADAPADKTRAADRPASPSNNPQSTVAPRRFPPPTDTPPARSRRTFPSLSTPRWPSKGRLTLTLLSIVGMTLSLGWLALSCARLIDLSNRDAPRGIPVGDFPGDVAVGEGAVWVVNHGDDTVSRIDPATNRTVGDPIRVGLGPEGVAVGEGAVWVVSNDAVSQIDPATNRRVGAPLRVGPGLVGVAVGEGAVWVISLDDTVSRIDPATNRRVGDPIGVGRFPWGVAVGEGAVWVANRYNTVSRIDPATNRTVGDPIGVGPSPGGVAVGAGAVWVINRDHTVSRIDPATNRTVRDPIGAVGPSGPQDVAVGEGAVWVTNFRDHTVSRIDPATNRTVGDPIRVGLGPEGVAVGEGAVWVTNSADDTVSRIDPATNRTVAP